MPFPANPGQCFCRRRSRRRAGVGGSPRRKPVVFFKDTASPFGAWSVLFGTARQNEFARIKILLKKANAPVQEHPKAPLADQGWCSAQRIKIEMIASGNHTLICAAPVRTLGLRGSELSSFRALSIKRSFTIPQSRACVRRASQLPLHKGAVGCSRTSALFRTIPAQKNRVPKNRDAAEICAIQPISP